MANDLPISNMNSRNDDTTGSSVAAGSENQEENCQIDADSNNPQEFLIKASRDAEQAKSAVRQAINNAFREREESLKKAEALAQAFDEAIQHSAAPASQSISGDAAPGSPHYSLDQANKGLVKKILNNSSVPSSPLSDIIRTYFGAKPDTEAKKSIGNPAATINQGQNLRRVIDPVTGDQAHERAANMIGEAKSDRLASKLVVSQAQDEIKKVREEAESIKKTAEEEVRRAREAADISRKDAEDAINLAQRWIEHARSEAAAGNNAVALIANQVRQQTISQAAEEIKKAKDEVKAAKEAAATAIKLAQEEIDRVRQEAETCKKNARTTVAALEEKIMKVLEKIETVKQQSMISISEAQAEALKAKEEAETTRRESQAVVNQARMESRKAIEEARLEMTKVRETDIKSEQHAYDQILETIEQLKVEAEITKQAASEAVSKAREEARVAREEAEIAKKASQDAVLCAIQDTQKPEEETEPTRVFEPDSPDNTREGSCTAREEAEAAIMEANDAVIKARQDIIGMTINEISADRQEFEETDNNPETLFNALPEKDAPTQEQTIDTINEMTSGTQKLEQQFQRILNPVVSGSDIDFWTKTLPPATTFNKIDVNSSQISITGFTALPERVVEYVESLESSGIFTAANIIWIDNNTDNTLNVSFLIYIIR